MSDPSFSSELVFSPCQISSHPLGQCGVRVPGWVRRVWVRSTNNSSMHASPQLAAHRVLQRASFPPRCVGSELQWTAWHSARAFVFHECTTRQCWLFKPNDTVNKGKVRQLCLCCSHSQILHVERSVYICVDFDASLSWWSANKFLKISQVIGVGRSFWRRRCKCSGSGSSHARSKGWLMTVVVVYISPFVALSLGLAPRWQLLSQLVMYTESIQQILRVSDQYPWSLCALLAVISSEHRWWACGWLLQNMYTQTQRGSRSNEMSCSRTENRLIVTKSHQNNRNAFKSYSKIYILSLIEHLIY